MMDTSEGNDTEINSSSGSRRYDVFPSFSGEDVRRSFFSHLLGALKRKSIRTYIDHEIERGRRIAPALSSAIRESSISMVIFSKNYASSTWCLDELVEIHDRSKKLDPQMVIPVFYDVDTSDVRKQTGEFGKVFKVTCKDKTEDQKLRWVQALADVANMAGEDLHNWPDEAHVVEKIANDVSNKLISPSPSNSFGVGIEAHLEALISMLCLESKEAKMVGIWGTSGIGKSTIGRALFSQLSGQFPLRYFENYRKSTDHDVSGMKSSWEQKFLSKILGQKDIQEECFGVVEKRFKDKKVLIVLDDVDNLEFLKTLVGETQWFGPGSRIVVITQDRRLLKAHDIDLLYEVKFPSKDLALKMLCRSAFGVDSPPDDFKELATEVSKLAGNLPLGLSLLGSSLKGKEKKEWMETLPELENGLDIINIMKPLKVSYDRLAEKDQKIFHYLAAFFNGFSVERINDVLGDVNIRLKTLVEKSLIRITQDKRVEMHNLLVKLGKEIVRAESKDNPGKRRFLDDGKEILDVLTDKTGTEIVLGIDFTTSSLSDIIEEFISIDENSFEGMLNLQLLKINDFWPRSRLCLPNGLDYLPRKLKWLEWSRCPLKCLPSNFKAEYLVELRMVASELEKLWEGSPSLANLKRMDMSGSIYLKEVPDLSKTIKLKEVNLYNCEQLESFPTPLNWKYLEYLNLQECPQLKNFPMIKMESYSHGIEIRVDCSWHKNLSVLNYLECFKRSHPRPEHLVCLTVTGDKLEKLWEGVQSLGGLMKLNLLGCVNLREIPDLSEATNLEYLILTNCKSLVTLHSSIGNLQKLVKLYLLECGNLTEIPDLSKATNLQELNLSKCKSLVMLHSSIGNLQKLVEMNLSGCENLTEIPDLSKATNLQELNIFNCKSLVILPSTVGNLRKLVELEIMECTGLKVLPVNVNLSSLESLNLLGCSSLRSFPQISKRISILNLSDTAIEEVPCCIEMLSRLTKLYMHGCKMLKTISLNIFSLASLKSVDFTDCGGVTTLLSDATVVAKMEGHNEYIKKRNDLDEDDQEEVTEDEDEDGKYFNFQNCFKLDGDARELILRSSFKWTMVLPGEKVPTYFEHRAYGNSLSVTLPQSSLSQEFLLFNACVVVEPLTHYYACISVHFHVNGEHYMHTVAKNISMECETDHLVLCSFKFRPTNLPSTLDFNDVEFKFYGLKRIKECGIRLLNVSPYPDDSDENSKTEYNQQFGEKCDVVEAEAGKIEPLDIRTVSKRKYEVQYLTPSLDDLPRSVVSTMHQGSVVTSMDFHPSHPTLLTVGCSSGEVTLWEVGSGEKVVTEPFKIWNMAACSVIFQGSIVNDPSISVSRVSWSPDGNFLGVAFTKHLVHVYRGVPKGTNKKLDLWSELHQHLEMDAHVGCVNDLAFAYPDNQLCIVTCGDDKLIKVWDFSGKKLYTLEGHEAPVYSVCLHQKENIPFIFSTALDGKIKTSINDNKSCIADWDTTGHCYYTTMQDSAYGRRLFSCGTSKDGDSFLVEWDTSVGSIKRRYLGFKKKSTGVVQFDTEHTRILAVDADGGLPSLPRLRFNKEGNLLAVTTADNGFKILANEDGLRSLRVTEARSCEAS